MRKRTVAVALCAATIVAAGFVSAPAPARSQEAPALSDRRMDVVYLNRSVARRVSVSVPRFEMAGTLPKLEADVTNTTSSERRFEYKIEWLTEEGGAAQTTSTWRTLFLLPNETQTLMSVGQVRHAHRARLSLRETARRPN